ncbi:MAG: hypothetical protein KY432_08935, partial [Acidobacteria bacterium]|nr:hypothetical protein [Acidobacteriota bacterium]
MSNPLQKLADAGQSVWYDQMTRSLLTQGHLRRMIEEDRLGGLTSNPTIFEKAIGGSGEYDGELARLSEQGIDRKSVYETLAFEDIGGAADVFRELYDSTAGEHGYVSLEVDPRLRKHAVERADPRQPPARADGNTTRTGQELHRVNEQLGPLRELVPA